MSVVSQTPVSMAVILAMTAVSFVLIVAAAIGGSYLVALNAIHTAQNQAAATLSAQEQAQVNSSAITCTNLVSLNNARNGIDFSAPTKTGTAELYVIRFSTALNQLVVGTKCPELLQDVAKHQTPAQILKELGE